MSYKLKVTCYNSQIITSPNHLIILFCFLLSAFCFLPCAAQTKFGHVDYGEIMKNMKGIDSIQTVIVNYQADLQAIAEQMVAEIKEKETAFEKLSTAANTSQAVLKIRQDELVSLYKRFQEFSQSAEVDIKDKQIELLEPFQKELLEAIKIVAKANNYNYIFDISTLMFYNPSDDLTEKVKTELIIK
jgi:Skp family chaperone for outer membrane proteins